MNTRESAAYQTKPQYEPHLAANDDRGGYSRDANIKEQNAKREPPLTATRTQVGRRTLRRSYDFSSTQAAMAFLAQVEVAGARGQLPHLDVRGVEVAIRVEAPVAVGFLDPTANDEESVESEPRPGGRRSDALGRD